MTLDDFEEMMRREQEERQMAGLPPAFNPGEEVGYVPPQGRAGPELAPMPRAAAPAPAADFGPVAAYKPNASGGFGAGMDPVVDPRATAGENAFRRAMEGRGFVRSADGVYADTSGVFGDGVRPWTNGQIAANFEARRLQANEAAERARQVELVGFDKVAAQQQQQRQFDAEQALGREKLTSAERQANAHTAAQVAAAQADRDFRSGESDKSRKFEADQARQKQEADAAIRKEIADLQAKTRLADSRDRFGESEFALWRQSPEGKRATPQQVQAKYAELQQAGTAARAGTPGGDILGVPPKPAVDPAAQNRLAAAVSQGRLGYGLEGVGGDGKTAAAPDFSTEAGNKFLDLISRGYTPDEQQQIIEQVIGGGVGPGRQVAESIIRAAAAAKMRGETKDDLSAGMSPFTPLFGAARAAYNRPPVLAGGSIPGLTVGSNATAVGRFGRTLLGLGNEGNVYNQASYGGLTVPLDMADVGFNRGGDLDPGEQARINSRLLAAQQTLDFMQRMGYGGMTARR